MNHSILGQNESSANVWSLKCSHLSFSYVRRHQGSQKLRVGLAIKQSWGEPEGNRWRPPGLCSCSCTSGHWEIIPFPCRQTEWKNISESRPGNSLFPGRLQAVSSSKEGEQVSETFLIFLTLFSCSHTRGWISRPGFQSSSFKGNYFVPA